VPGFVHAPGGQLIQATDQWVGVKGARLVLIDDELVRAPVVAAWLRQLGHDACVVDEGVSPAADAIAGREAGSFAVTARLADAEGQSAAEHPERGDAAITFTPHELASALSAGTVQVIDLRPSMVYRKGHIPGAVWSIRPRIAAAADRTKSTVLISDDLLVPALAMADLAEAGVRKLGELRGGFEAWRAAGLPVEATPDAPADADCIDFLFFTARRHDGDREAARQYLAWETGLLAQLDEQERGVFFSLDPNA
jgi:rhodanese-related sulfurtransferase